MYKAHFSLDVKGFNSDEEARDFLFDKLLHTLTWHEVIPYELLSIPWEYDEYKIEYSVTKETTPKPPPQKEKVLTMER